MCARPYVLGKGKLAYVHCLLSLAAQPGVVCSQQTQGQSRATLNQPAVSFRRGAKTSSGCRRNTSAAALEGRG